MRWVYILPINPEPWAVGKAYAMRGRGGAGISPNRKLVAFQEAAREALLADYDPPLITTPVSLKFYFKRALEELSYGSKAAHAQRSDATNLQKALEDAMQGILYKNDNQVVDIHSVIIEQEVNTEPMIVIEVDDQPMIQNEIFNMRQRMAAWFKRRPKIETPQNNDW